MSELSVNTELLGIGLNTISEASRLTRVPVHYPPMALRLTLSLRRWPAWSGGRRLCRRSQGSDAAHDCARRRAPRL